ADTGVGIAPEDQAAIFEEFRQVGSDERKQEGTGLGLTLAKKFVDLHGGRIWVESAVGHGATVTFTLPAKGSREGYICREPAGAVKVGRPIPCRRIRVWCQAPGCQERPLPPRTGVPCAPRGDSGASMRTACLTSRSRRR